MICLHPIFSPIVSLPEQLIPSMLDYIRARTWEVRGSDQCLNTIPAIDHLDSSFFMCRMGIKIPILGFPGGAVV